MSSHADLQIYKNSRLFPFDSSDNRRQKSPLVLIADQDDNQRRMLDAMLDLWNIEVLEAENGEETIDLTVRARPNLILINTDLPRLDGFETTRLIRKIKSLDAMPIIFLSTRTERAERKKAFSAGGDGFHIAPLDHERLDYILENFLFVESQTNVGIGESPNRIF